MFWRLLLGFGVRSTALALLCAIPHGWAQSVSPPVAVPLVASAVAPRKVPAYPLTALYLYRSEATLQMLGRRRAEYEDVWSHWRKFFSGRQPEVREVGRSELLEGLAPGVLIVPGAQVLDRRERQALLDFMARGGSLWGTGQLGNREESGRLIGHEFLQTAFRATVHGYFGGGIEWFLQPNGDGPLTWSLPAGRRMDLGKPAKDTLPRLKAAQLAAVVMQWSREKDDEPIGAIAFDETATSRSVYYAFPESAWDFQKPEDLSALLDSTLAWLQRSPRAFKAAWPQGKQAAHLIEMDTEDKFFSATTLADHLESIGVRGTFYSVTTEAIKFPNVVPELLSRGHEIAYHADVHYGFKLEPLREQDLRVQFMIAQMRSLMGDRIGEATGFRAPTESYDMNTERVLRRNGLLHHAADPAASDDRLPFFSRAEPRMNTDIALVVLPRTQMDDVDFTGRNMTPDQVYDTLVYDLDLTLAQGGFGLLSVHSQNYVEGGLMQRTMGRYVAHVGQKLGALWVTRADEIVRWWRAREKVRVVQEPALGPGGDVFIRVGTPAVVRGLTVDVTLPFPQARVLVQALDGRAPRPAVQALDAYRAALVFDVFEAGEARYVIRFVAP